MPHKPWELVDANTFTIKSNTSLCILYYYSKFPVLRKTDGLSADNLIGVVKIVFAEFGFPKKIVSDANTNFISDKFRQFCRQLNIQQAITLSYYPKRNGQVKACIKFLKCTIKMHLDNYDDINLVLL